MTRRLGERRPDWYGPHAGRLAKAAHTDFHTWTLLVDDPPFVLEDLSGEGHEEQLSAASESAWAIKPGDWKWGPHHFPRPMLLDTLERRTRRKAEVQAVLAAWRHLREYEPHGEVLFRVLFVDCIALPPTLNRRGQWIHHDKKFYRLRDEAWEIVAVLAVEPAVLRLAEKAGAVDARALAWARERSLVDV